jgi:predicted MFS family arabinose efflux permease
MADVLGGAGLSLASASRPMAAFSLGGFIGGLLAGVLVHGLGSRHTLWILCIVAVAFGRAGAIASSFTGYVTLDLGAPGGSLSVSRWRFYWR